MAIAFYLVLVFSGSNDVIAEKFDISLNATTWIGRIGLILLPPIAYVLTYRICLGLQQHDREVLEHGIETGVIRRLPQGEFIEVHQPLGPVDEHGHGTLAYGGAPVPKRMNQIGGAARAIHGFFRPIEEPSAAARERVAVGSGPASDRGMPGDDGARSGRTRALSAGHRAERIDRTIPDQRNPGGATPSHRLVPSWFTSKRRPDGGAIPSSRSPADSDDATAKDQTLPRGQLDD
jgi:hypothetical protein